MPENSQNIKVNCPVCGFSGYRIIANEVLCAKCNSKMLFIDANKTKNEDLEYNQNYLQTKKNANIVQVSLIIVLVILLLPIFIIFAPILIPLVGFSFAVIELFGAIFGKR